MSLFTDVQTLLDEVAGAVFWSADQIYDAINQAQLEAQFLVQDRTVGASMVCTQGSEFATVPTTVMLPQFIVYGGKEYWPSTYEELENWDQDWRAESQAQPKVFISWDWNHFRLWPVPDANYTVTVWGVPWPTEVAAASLDITETTAYKEWITFKAGAALILNTLPQAAQVWLVEAKELERQWRRHKQLNLGAYRFNRFRPGTAFTVGQRGSPAVWKRFS